MLNAEVNSFYGIKIVCFKKKILCKQAARTVFKKAREDERSNFHVYVAAALMEYYSSKDKNVAFRFEPLSCRVLIFLHWFYLFQDI